MFFFSPFLHTKKSPIFLPILLPTIFFALGIFFYYSSYAWYGMLPFLCWLRWYTPLILVGYLWSMVYEYQFLHTFLAEPVAKQRIEGTIERMENQRRLVVATPAGRFRLFASPKLQLEEGDWIQAKAELWPIADPITPYSFDPKFDARLKGIHAGGRLIWLKKRIHHPTLRQRISDRISAHMPPDAAAVAHAILLGEKGYLDRATKSQYAASGIAHLLAISGLHLMLISQMIFLIIRGSLCLFVHRFDPKKIAAACSIACAFAYMAIAGFGYPVQRATLMLTWLMMGIMLDRLSVSMESVAWAGFIILLCHPESLFSLSFQLSFAAVIPLIAAFAYYKRLSIINSTLIASAATTPLIAIAFHQITLTAPITNVLCIPLFTYLVMPLSLPSLLWGEPFYTLWGWSIQAVSAIAAFMAEWPGSQIFVPMPSTHLPLIFFVIGGIVLCVLQNRWGWLAIAAAFACYRPLEPPQEFNGPNGLYAWRDGAFLYTKEKRKGRGVLQEWCRVYGLTLKRV